MSGANSVPLGNPRKLAHSEVSARDIKLLGLLSNMRESNKRTDSGSGSDTSTDSDSGEQKPKKSKKSKKHKKQRKHDHDDNHEKRSKKKHKKHKKSKRDSPDGVTSSTIKHSVFESDFSFPTQENDANLKDASATAPMKPAQVFSAPAWAQAKGGQSSIEVNGDALQTMEKVKRMPTHMSDTMCKLTGVERPVDDTPSAAPEEKRTFTCYRCGREGHTTTRCKETYSKAGKRLMKGHR